MAPNTSLRRVLSLAAAAAITATLIGGQAVGASAPSGSADPRSGPQRHSAPGRHRDESTYQSQKFAADGGAGSSQTGRRAGQTGSQSSVQATANGFNGVDLAQSNALFGDQGYFPPDNGTAVNGTDIVEMVNSVGVVWPESGGVHGSPLASFDLNSLFGVNTGAGFSFSDPRVVWDAADSRWIASGLDFKCGATCATTGGSNIEVAVSDSSDPTSTWHHWQVWSSTSLLGDQPRLGVSSDKVVVTFDDYTNAGAFQGEDGVVIGKTALINGSASPLIQPITSALNAAAVACGTNPECSVFGVVPASYSTGSDVWAMYNNADATGASENQGLSSPTLAVLQISGSAGSVTLTPTYLATTAVAVPPSASQGTGARIDTGDDRLQKTWLSGTTLWSGADVDCVPAGDTTARSCLRLWSVSVASTPSMLQDFNVGSAGAYLYYPAITMDAAGDMFTVFTESSASLTPSLEALAQPNGATAGTYTGFLQLAAGQGRYGGSSTNSCPEGNSVCRWGDYSSAVVDPSDTTKIWVSGEYAATATDPTNWGTYNAQLNLVAGGPQVTSVGPNSGTAAGGTAVTITGTAFTGATKVFFGSTVVPSSGFSSASATQIVVNSPAHPSGTFDLTVETPAGISPQIAADHFSYTPEIDSLTAISGPATGGTSTTLVGYGLAGTTAVTFGGLAGTVGTSADDQHVTVTTPAYCVANPPHTVAVAVVSGGQAGSRPSAFTYNTVSAPALTSLSPSSGPTGGGTAVKINGSGLGCVTRVNFGTAHPALSPGAGFVSTTSPPVPAAGPVSVTLSDAFGQTSNAETFDYIPAVTSVSPAFGAPAGGQTVQVNGAGFGSTSSGLTVSFGSANAAITSVTPTQITVTDPAGPAAGGPVTVSVTVGTESGSLPNGFTYVIGGYTADESGGLHPFGWGGAVPPRPSSVEGSWPGQNVIRGVVTRSDRLSGYTLDLYGGVHPFGGAPPIPLSTYDAYWPGSNVARAIALNPCDATGTSGWVLDLFGGVHSFGGAPALANGAYWAGSDIARALSLYCVSGQPAGFLADLYGGLHPLATNSSLWPGVPSDAPYWPGYDLVRGIVMNGPGTGYLADAWGGVHEFGGQAKIYPPGFWPGQDVVRGIAILPGETGGVITDFFGGVEGWGGAPNPTVLDWFPGQAIIKGVA